MELMYNNTGEVLTLQKAPSPFRSITDLKDYNDNERYEEGTSLVDLTGYEPLESVIARCTRLMRGRNGQEYQVIDRDMLKAEMTMPGVYEAGNATSIDEAFETEDITDAPMFDLSDAGEIINNLSTLPTSASDEQANISQAQSEPVVDNEVKLNNEPALDEKNKA